MKRDIERLLLRLAGDSRILGSSDPESGLRLEKRLDPTQSAARQKERWAQAFGTPLERELGVAA